MRETCTFTHDEPSVRISPIKCFGYHDFAVRIKVSGECRKRTRVLQEVGRPAGGREQCPTMSRNGEEYPERPEPAGVHQRRRAVPPC